VDGFGGFDVWYLPDDVVSVAANAAPAGKAFDRWVSGGGGTFSDASLAVVTFTMPANAVTITATYKNSTLDPTIEDSVSCYRDGYVTGLPLGENTVNGILSRRTNNATLRVVDGKGNVLGLTDVVGTGMRLQLMQGGLPVDEQEILVRGDVSGDGNINIFDIMADRDHIFGKTVLDGVYLKAAEVTADLNVNIFDIMAVRDHIFGKTLIAQ
jgi:hypothetical protein